MAKKFKEFLEEEGLDSSKNKSHVRVGWDGRQDEIDTIASLNVTLRDHRMKSLEKYEASRSKVVTLEETVQSNAELVAKSEKIAKQNEELLKENKKINIALTKIAGDIASYSNEIYYKDAEIETLKINHKQQIKSLREQFRKK